jgi:hypothetical protein
MMNELTRVLRDNLISADFLQNHTIMQNEKAGSVFTVLRGDGVALATLTRSVSQTDDEFWKVSYRKILSSDSKTEVEERTTIKLDSRETISELQKILDDISPVVAIVA